MAGSILGSPLADPAAALLDPAVAAADPALASGGTPVSVSPGRETWKRFRRHKLAVASVGVLAILAGGVLFGPLIWRVAIDDIDFAAMLQPPSWAHPFGTDDLGQDVLARMIYGGRISLAVGFAAMLVATVVGIVVGSAAGMSRRMLDPVLMWVTDLFLSLPQLPLLLLIIYLFRDNLKAAFGVEGGVFVMIVAVSRAQGAGPLHIVVRHILPNAIGPVIVAATIEVSAAIIAESTLSFLGLGFPPDIPTWGRILFDAKDHLDVAPHWALFPGAAIFLTVLSINFIGDGLRDALDPRRIL